MTSKKSYSVTAIILAGLISLLSSASLAGTVGLKYGYDPNGRLERAALENGLATKYSYDAVGNRERTETGVVPNRVAAGNYHSAVLLKDGTVWAWGGNDFGQLGDGTNVSRPTPMRVKGEGGIGYLTDVMTVGAGERHTVALKDDLTVWVWGMNTTGQLGVDTSPDNYGSTPKREEGLSGVVAIAVGSNHTLALRSDGTLWAWGFNVSGQLGDGTTTNGLAPIQVKGPDGVGFMEDVVAIAAGPNHSAAIKSDGTVWAWGDNGWGQLGRVGL